MRRDAVAAVVALSSWSGALAGMRLPIVAWSSVVLGLLAVAAWLRVSGRRRVLRTVAGVMVLCTVAAASLAGASWLRVQSTAASPLVALAEKDGIARVRLVTTGDPVRLRDGSGLLGDAPRGFRVTARVETVVAGDAAVSTRSSVLLLVPSSWAQLVPGTRVEAVLRWSPAREVGLAAVGSARAGPRVVGGPPRYSERRRRCAVG